jgi:hypothetical protein
MHKTYRARIIGEWLQIIPPRTVEGPPFISWDFLIALRASSSQAAAINSNVSLSSGLVIWAASSRHRLAKSSDALRMIPFPQLAALTAAWPI